MVTAAIHKLDDANPDFYACLKEATMLEDLHFNIARRDSIAQPPTPSEVPPFPACIHNNIRKLTLDGEIPSILDRCSMSNLKDLLVYSDYRPWWDQKSRDPSPICGALRE
ncbi:uncharacterized protein ARMOST_17915 [Armillaria ostoyae]|uniref:Uncharacterized protein n=1 Tax=Armillaria ostoyae TaxID=47428 RepID=A0A284S0C6_ARMOS|nr:uncharacterized protein ARMOST_17915 [Armillaria ostoyae]